MHTVITEAGRNWDPEKWDGEVWDSTNLDSSSEGEVFIEAKTILQRKLEHDPLGHPVRWDVVDFTQHTINDIMDRFKQKPGESLLSWAIRLHDLRASGVKLDPDNVKKFVMLSSNSFVQDTFRGTEDETNLLAVVVEGCNRKYPTEGE